MKTNTVKRNDILALMIKEESYDGERREKLKKLLLKIINDELKKKEKEYLYLYIIESRKINEIAEMKGVNKSTVSRSLNRSLSKIRKILGYTVVS